MANTLKPYLDAIRKTLTVGLCLRNFASQVVEKHNKPEVECQMNRELLLQPVVIARNKHEKCLIEGSINALRISICVKQSDKLDTMLVDKFSRFLAQRAEEFVILRRAPIEGYDVSFLFTHLHVEGMLKNKLIDFVIHFMQEIDMEVSDMKLSVNARARVVATTFFKQF